MAGAILRLLLGRVAFIALTVWAVRLIALPAVCTSGTILGGLDGFRGAADAITRTLDGAGRL